MKDNKNIPPDYIQASEYADAFFAQEANRPAKVGNGYITSSAYLKGFVGLLLTFIPFLLLLLNSLSIDKWLLGYAYFATAFAIFASDTNKKYMLYELNPFDFVKFQFSLFILYIIQISFANYILFLVNPMSFKGNIGNDSTFFDFIYYSVVTITTLGYGDIFPNTTAAKFNVVYELGVGLWFLITVIPTAISFQSERRFQLYNDRKKFLEAVSKAQNDGKLEQVYPPETGNESGKKEK